MTASMLSFADLFRGTLAVLAVALLIRLLRKPGSRAPAGPRYLLGLGPVFSYLRFIFTTVPEAASFYGNKYGDFVRVWIDGVETYIITRPSLTWQILKSNKYTSRFGNEVGLTHIGMFDSGIIWNNNVPKWRYLRSFFQKALNADTLERACVVAMEETSKQIDRLPIITKRMKDSSVETLDFVRWISFLATNRLMLGVEISDEEAEEIVADIVQYFKAWEYFLLRPPILYYGSNHRKHMAAIEKVNGSMQMLIDRKRILYTKWRNDGNEVTDESDFMTQILYEEENGKLDDRDVRQCLLEMLLAGTDTSSVTIFYLFVYLSEYSEVEQNVYEEILTVLGRGEEALTKSKLDQMTYLEQVIKESLRIKPVGPVSIRLATQDDKIEGTYIPKGTRVILNYAEMHRRTEVYPDPDVFDPNRFEKSSNKIGKEDFVPFGTGPKGCVGQYLAMIEMKSIISVILKRYKLVNAGKTTTGMKTSWDIAQQPCDPQFMHFVERV